MTDDNLARTRRFLQLRDRAGRRPNNEQFPVYLGVAHQGQVDVSGVNTSRHFQRY